MDPDSSTSNQPTSRGRGAKVPTDIPKRGWLDVLWRVKQEADKDAVAFYAAGVAFYFLLALVPAMAAVAAIYGLVVDRTTVVEHASQLNGVLPTQVVELIQTELTTLAQSDAKSGWALFLGILLALWGSSKGIEAITIALNVVYDEKETRGFVKRKLNSLFLAGCLVGFLCIILVLLVVAPAIIAFAGLGNFSDMLIAILRWPLLLITLLAGLSVLYRFAPCRTNPRWNWVAPGSIAAALLCAITYAGLTVYAMYSGDGSKTYGSLAAVILLMSCFYLTALAVLLGGELNAEAEHQTERDTTTGKPRPMGERGAYVADTLGALPRTKDT